MKTKTIDTKNQPPLCFSNGKLKQNENTIGVSEELHTQLNMNLHDYGARYYDAAVGRFTGIDPIANKFSNLSPYNYAANSPIANIDLWGLQAFEYGLYMQFKRIQAKYSNPVQQFVNHGSKVMNGHDPTANIPKSANLSASDRKLIKTISKVHNANKAVDGAKEIGKLTNELVSEGLSNLSNGMKAVGYGLAIPTEGASLAIVPVAETIGLVASSMDITSDLASGNYVEAGSKVAIEATFSTTGDLLGNEATKQAWKTGEKGIMNFLNEAASQIAGWVRNQTSNKIEKNEKEKQ